MEPVANPGCSRCHSTRIVKNGTNRSGNTQFHCKDCGKYGTLNPKQRYTSQQRRAILKAYLEDPSMRSIERKFGVTRQTLSKWLRQK